MPAHIITTEDTEEKSNTMDRYLNRLAAAVGTIINTLDPETLVFGGGLSNYTKIYDNLPKRINQFIMTERCNTKFVPALHGDSSGIRGAARL